VNIKEALPGTLSDPQDPNPAVVQGQVPEGLCATLLNTEPVISGDEAVELGAAATDAGGNVVFDGISVKPALGFLVQVDIVAGASIGEYTATDTAETDPLTFQADFIGGFPGQAVVIADPPAAK